MPEVRINLTAKDNASDDIKRVKKSLEKLARTKDIKINVSAPKLAEIKRSIGNIRDKSVRVNANAVGLKPLRNELNRLPTSKQIRIRANVTGVADIRNQVANLTRNKDIKFKATVTGLKTIQNQVAELIKPKVIKFRAEMVGLPGCLLYTSPSPRDS